MSGRDTTLTREQAHDVAAGGSFFLGFGAVWMATGLEQTHRGSAVAMLSLAVTSAVLLAGSAHLMRRSRDLPDAQISWEEQVRAQRMLTATSIILWVSIATAVAILGLLHMPEYIMPAISILVGLHLFRLAGSFPYREHYVAGLALLLWSLGCLGLLSKQRVSGICALGVGAVLLLSAAVALARTFAAMRTEQPPNAVARS